MNSNTKQPPLLDLGGDPHPLSVAHEHVTVVLYKQKYGQLHWFLGNVVGYIASIERQLARQQEQIAELQKRLGMLEDEDGP